MLIQRSNYRMNVRYASALFPISASTLIALLIMLSVSRQLIVIDGLFISMLLVGTAIGIVTCVLPKPLQNAAFLVLFLLFVDALGLQTLLNTLNFLEPPMRSAAKLVVLISIFGGCLLIFLVLKENFAEVFFVTVLAATVIGIGQALLTTPISFGDTSRIVHSIQPEPGSQSRNPELPIKLHIMLDGHLPPAALAFALPGSEPIAEFLREFYLRHGFLLYEKTYTRFRWTRMSMASAFNFDVETTDPVDLYIDETIDKVFSLRTNKYFDSFQERGYIISVASQIGYLDFCSTEHVVKCSTIVGTRKTRLPYHMVLYNAYTRLARPFGLTWLPDRTRFYENTYNIVDDVVAEMSSVRPGEMIFAHIFPPHQPWYLNSNCEISTTEKQGPNAFSQVIKCVYGKLDNLFSELERRGLFENAEIVIHGDHGMRLDTHRLNDSEIFRTGSANPQTIVANYGALFAIRAPTVEPGYDEKLTSIQSLMSKYFGSTLPNSTGDTNMVIYRGKEGRDDSFVSMSMPQAWN